MGSTLGSTLGSALGSALIVFLKGQNSLIHVIKPCQVSNTHTHITDNE